MKKLYNFIFNKNRNRSWPIHLPFWQTSTSYIWENWHFLEKCIGEKYSFLIQRIGIYLECPFLSEFGKNYGFLVFFFKKKVEGGVLNFKLIPKNILARFWVNSKSMQNFQSANAYFTVLLLLKQPT